LAHEFAALNAELTMPTRFLRGAENRTFSEPLAREMTTQFPCVAGFHAIARGRLFFYLEHPDEVATRIEAFVRH